MIQDILFHGRIVKQRRCDHCGKIIYLQEDIHSVRKRCRAHSRAYLMYEELNKISLGVTEYWHNGICTHVCKYCAGKDPKPDGEVVREYVNCMYTEDDDAVVETYNGEDNDWEDECECFQGGETCES